MIIFAANFAFLQWIENTEPAIFLRQSVWLYPSVEILHIIGFAVLVGAVFLFDLRLLGMARKLPVTDCIKHFIRWALISFALVLPSGTLLFMVDATSIGMNAAFRLKLILILLAGLNAALFHLFTRKSIEEWNVDRIPPLKAKLAGIISILLWFSVIAAGRLIAYV